VRPIFHLSFPVRDLAEVIRFYTEHLGATIGRRTEAFADALVFGAQVTLQNDPSAVLSPSPRSRHFGATIDWSQWEDYADRFADGPLIIEKPTVSYVGEPIEQGKLMISDPSGNLIEIKAYRNPEVVLGALAERT
jgi:extradiol dioxygenase family protein